MLQVTEAQLVVGSRHRLTITPTLNRLTQHYVECVILTYSELIANSVIPAPTVGQRHRLSYRVDLTTVGLGQLIVSRRERAVARATHHITPLSTPSQVLDRLQDSIEAGLQVVRLAAVLVNRPIQISQRVTVRTVRDIPVVAVILLILEVIVLTIRTVNVHQRALYDCGVEVIPIDTAGRERTLLEAVTIVQSLTHLQNVEITTLQNNVIRVDTQVISSQRRHCTRNTQSSLLLIPTQTDRIGRTLSTARDIDSVALDRSVAILHLLQPVGTLPAVCTDSLKILLGNVSLPIPRSVAVHYASLVHNSHILLSVQDSRYLIKVLYAIVAIVCYFACTRLTLLCCNQNDAIGSARTIDSCRGCVFQNIDRLNIRRIQ